MVHNPRIKICGLKSLADIELLSKYRIDYAGFIFHEASPRCLEPEGAIELIKVSKKMGLKTVGVFGNQNSADMISIVQETGLDFIQLHGKGSRAALLDLPKDLQKIYVVEVENSAFDFESTLLNYLDPQQDFILLDRPKSQKEPIKLPQDFSIFKDFKCFLAGGLTAENVQSYLQALSPYAIDICSAVEENGKKSAMLLEELTQKVMR